MTAAEERATSEAELDDLRRRLYRAGATDADLRRYLDERAAEVPEDEPVAPSVPPRPRRRLVLVAVVGLVAFTAVTTAVVAQQRPSSAHVSVDVDDGHVFTPDPVRVTGSTSTEISIDGGSTAQRFDGVGDGVLPVHLPGAELESRRAVVAVYSDRTSTVVWRANRFVFGTSAAADEQVVAKARITSRVDDATPTEFSYSGAPPTELAVEAPVGTHWTVIVAAVRD